MTNNLKTLVSSIAKDLTYDPSIRDGIYISKNSPDSPYQEFYHQSHGEDLLPDDHRYKMIYDIINDIADYLSIDATIDTLDDYSTERFDNLIPIYTNELLNWLSSNNIRFTYVDDAISEYGKRESLTDDIMTGYMMELEETYQLMLSWINNTVDEMDDNDESNDNNTDNDDGLDHDTYYYVDGMRISKDYIPSKPVK